MHVSSLISRWAILTVVFTASPLIAQTSPSYGVSISLDLAQRCRAGATAEAKKNGWNVTITVLDAGGHAILVQRMDGVQFGSVAVAHDKAYSAVAFRRSTKTFDEMVVQGGSGLRLLKVPGLTPVEGGLPIVHDGHVIGGIGVSGATAQQDGQIAQACLNALQEQPTEKEAADAPAR